MEVQTDVTLGQSSYRVNEEDSNLQTRQQNLINAFLAQIVYEVPAVADEDKVQYFTNDVEPVGSDVITGEDTESVTLTPTQSGGVVESKSEIDKVDSLEGKQISLAVDEDLERGLLVSACTEPNTAKLMISSKYKVGPENIKLSLRGKNLKKSIRLGGPLEEDDKVDVEFVEDVSSDGDAAYRPEPKLSFLKVKYEKEDGSHKYLEVSIFDGGFSKQYLGGYRNKVTGKVYYHAFCQTDYYQKHLRQAPRMVTRELQTYLPRTEFGTNTDKDEVTQTWLPGEFESNFNDRMITPQKYVPYDEKHKTMIPEVAVIILQRSWRNYMAKKALLQQFQDIAAGQQAHFQIKASSLLEFRKKQITLLINTSHPTGRGNFSNLHMTVNQWVAKELKKLHQQKSGFALKSEYLNVLSKEVEMLFNIETLRIRAKEENLRRQDIRFLEGTARSRAREYPKGNVTLIDDLNIQKARVFKEMFANYTRSDTTPTERIEILSSIRQTLHKSFDNQEQSIEMLELLDREIDLLVMGLDKKHLTFLRKRFEQLFINFVRNPEVNPQAKYYRKSIVTEKTYSLHKCPNCSKVLPPHHLFKHLRMKKFSTCMSCAQMRQNTTASVNLAPYARILDILRKSELDKKCRSAIPFLLQPLGTHFIVNVLWNGKSIISGSEYLPELRLTRWIPDVDWTMWNTILLTEREAWKHDQIVDPIKHYDEEFVMRVRNRNILGRMHFDSLANIDRKFVTMRHTIGHLPKDHLLYTSPRHAKYIQEEKL